MKIFEVADPSTQKLVALSQFLLGRSTDESAKKQISQDAFINAAQSLGINVTPDTLGELISHEPLKNVLEPLDPNSGVIRFKGNDDPADAAMSVDQSRAIVDQNAKAAMRRGMK